MRNSARRSPVRESPARRTPAHHAPACRSSARQSPDRSPTERLAAAAGLFGAALLLGLPAVAHAADEVEVEALRSYTVSEGLRPAHPTEPWVGAEIMDSGPGRPALVAAIGSPPDMHCAFAYVTASGAREYTYRYEELATRCLNVVARPGGGFFVRAIAIDMTASGPMGVTALLDDEGVAVWEVPDPALIDATAHVGRYVEPHHVLAYSEPLDRLLAFSVAEVPDGDEGDYYISAQAHVLDATSGEVFVRGQLFEEDAATHVASAIARADGQFVVYDDQRRHFYSYDGDRDVAPLRPGDADWSARIINRPLRAGGPDDHLYVLWLSDEADSHVTAVDDQARQVWATPLPTRAQVDDEEVPVSPAMGMWVSPTHVLVMQSIKGVRHLRALDATSGQEVSLVALDELTPYASPRVFTDDDGALVLLVFDEDTNTYHEYALRFPRYEPTRTANDGCGCASTSGAPVGDALPVLVVAALFALGRSYRASRGC